MGSVGSLLSAGGQTRGPELRLDREKVAALIQDTPRSAPASQGLQEILQGSHPRATSPGVGGGMSGYQDGGGQREEPGIRVCGQRFFLATK